MTMMIEDVVKTLDGKLVAGADTGRAVGAVVANDLMSDVLLYDSDDILLLTSLASDQVVHNGKPLPEAMCQAAKNFGIPLVSTPLAKYQSCVRIHEFLSRQ